MGNCKDCKWLTGESITDGLRKCNQPKAYFGYGRQDIAEDGLQIEADEGWGWLMGPMFGCINFEVAG
ncbi:MAG TPA: hypothetical protein VMY06_14600 [Sedimentisphaerales bacterium]|nr:hypothetical protein [Sedimentisphaerales bacterium]HUU15549.1 hypothetical protein [Sedimentisphaerales bacterium]